MAITHKIYEESRFVLSTWTGVVTDDDFLQSFKELYEDKKWKAGFNELADLRKAELGNISAVGLRRVSELVDHYTAGKCDGFKTAIIAPKDFPYGMARLYEALSEETPEMVMVFRDVKKALEWLGLEESSLD